MIDLGVRSHDPPTEPAPSRPPLARQSRPVVALVGLLLAFVASGSAPAPEPALVEVAVLPTSATQDDYLLGDHLYTVRTEPPGSVPTIIATDLDRSAVVWTTTVDSRTGGGTGTGADGTRLNLRRVGDRILVDGCCGTIALDAATGQTHWSTPDQIVDAGRSGIGLSQQPDAWFWSDSQPGTESVAVAPTRRVSVWFDSATGDVVQTEMRDGAVALVNMVVGVQLRGIDIGTGTELWTSRPVRTGRLLPALDPPALVVVTIDGAVEVWDARTGNVRQSRPAVPDRPAVSAVGVGDVILVRDRSGTLTAHAADTLQPRWRTSSPADGSQPPWRTPPADNPGDLVSRGGHLLRLGPIGDGVATHTIDPRTGEPLIDLSGWAQLSAASDDSPAILDTFRGGPRRLWFGVLDSGATAVRILGVVPHRSFGCQSSSTHIVCKTRSDELRAWRHS